MKLQNWKAGGEYGDEATGKPFGEKKGLKVFVIPSGENRFAFPALAYGAPIGDTKNPVTVELRIGDDNGTTTGNASLY